MTENPILFAFLFILGVVIREDIKRLIPVLAHRMLRKAALRLPEIYRDRFLEEWLAHSDECITLTQKIFHAGSLYFGGADDLARALGCFPPVANHKIFRALDISLAVTMLPILLPTFLIISYLLKSSENSVFRKVKYYGLYGRSFWAYKFNDLSAIGQRSSVQRLLRKTGVSELPLLLSVMSGDMCFVGPRPSLSPEGFSARSKPGIARLVSTDRGVHASHDMSVADYFRSILLPGLWVFGRR